MYVLVIMYYRFVVEKEPGPETGRVSVAIYSIAVDDVRVIFAPLRKVVICHYVCRLPALPDIRIAAA